MRVRGLLLWIVLMAGFIGLLARPAWWAFSGPINAAKGEKARQAKATEIDRLRVQLAACGVAAMGNTRKALSRAVDSTAWGWSASYQAVDEAVALEAAGAPEMAAQVLEQAIAAPPPVVTLPSTAVKVDGVSVRENWQFCYDGAFPDQRWKDLTDEQRKRVLQFLPREYLQPDEAAIGKVVKALKSWTKISGLRAYDAGTVAVRG